jgi:hypothetical protein
MDQGSLPMSNGPPAAITPMVKMEAVQRKTLPYNFKTLTTKPEQRPQSIDLPNGQMNEPFRNINSYPIESERGNSISAYLPSKIEEPASYSQKNINNDFLPRGG